MRTINPYQIPSINANTSPESDRKTYFSERRKFSTMLCQKQKLLCNVKTIPDPVLVSHASPTSHVQRSLLSNYGTPSSSESDGDGMVNIADISV